MPELVRSFFLTSSLVLMFVGQQSIHGFISLLCFIFLFTFYTPMGRNVLVCDFFRSQFILLRARSGFFVILKKTNSLNSSENIQAFVF